MPHGDKRSTFHCLWLCGRPPLVEVLKQCGDNLTRENVMKQAASLKGFEIRCCCRASRSTPARRISIRSRSVQLSRFEGESMEAVRRRCCRTRAQASRRSRTTMPRPPGNSGGRANTQIGQMTQATAPFERIKPRPAYELVAEAIERKILTGRMRPGDPSARNPSWSSSSASTARPCARASACSSSRASSLASRADACWWRCRTTTVSPRA